MTDGKAIAQMKDSNIKRTGLFVVRVCFSLVIELVLLWVERN